MGDPAPADGHPVERTRLRSVLPPPTADAGATGSSDPAVLADLTARLAAALRAVRGYVPHHIWWDTGAADALIAYQATEET